MLSKRGVIQQFKYEKTWDFNHLANQRPGLSHLKCFWLCTDVNCYHWIAPLYPSQRRTSCRAARDISWNCGYPSHRSDDSVFSDVCPKWVRASGEGLGMRGARYGTVRVIPGFFPFPATLTATIRHILVMIHSQPKTSLYFNRWITWWPKYIHNNNAPTAKLINATSRRMPQIPRFIKYLFIQKLTYF